MKYFPDAAQGAKAIAGFLSDKATKQPLFSAIVSSRCNTAYFFLYAKEIASLGVLESDTVLFLDDQSVADFTFDNRFLLDGFSQSLSDGETSDLAMIDPRDLDEAKKYWLSIGLVEIKNVCSSFDKFCTLNNLYEDDEIYNDY